MRRRGNCGGPLAEDHPRTQLDERGRRYITDGAWLSGAAVEAERRWYACPISEVQAARPLIELYRRHTDGHLSIVDALGTPSAAAVEVLDTLAGARDDARAALAPILVKEAREKAKRERALRGG